MHKSIPATKPRKAIAAHPTSTTPRPRSTLTTQTLQYHSAATDSRGGSNNSSSKHQQQFSRGKPNKSKGGTKGGNKAKSKDQFKQSHNKAPGPTPIPLPVGYENIPVKFSDLGVSPELTKLLHSQGVIAPSEIQRRAIPALFNNNDVSITAPTGQGKTLAYALPLIQKLVADEALGRVSMPSAPRAVILVPTRELALQVEQTTKALSHAEGHRLRTRAITGDQSPATMRQILRGENSNRSLALLNATEGRVRDQIRLAATISSRIINQMFKENGWTYVNNTAKKVNKKVQQQRDESDDIKKQSLADRAAEIGDILQSVKEAVGAHTDDQTAVRITCTKKTKPHRENQGDEGEEEEAGGAEEMEVTQSDLNDLQDELSQINQLLESPESDDKRQTIRNWSQIKRLIKRETTRFSYALFAMSQDYEKALDALNTLGVGCAKDKRRALRKQGFKYSSVLGEIEVGHLQSDPKSRPESLKSVLADITNMSKVFHVDEEDLIPHLNTHAVAQIEPLAVRTVANEYVTTLAADKLHDDGRNSNFIQFPLPLLKTPNPYKISYATEIDPITGHHLRVSPVTRHKHAEYEERVKLREKLHKPIHVILPSELDIQSNLSGDINNQEEFEEQFGQIFGVHDDVVDPAQSQLVSRKAVHASKFPRDFDQGDDFLPPTHDHNREHDHEHEHEHDDAQSQKHQHFPVSGEYVELNRSSPTDNNHPTRPRDNLQDQSSNDDISTGEQLSEAGSHSELQPHSKHQHKLGQPDNISRHFSTEDHHINRQFFIDVDYVTKITLQSLIALSPYVFRYHDLTPAHDGEPINHDRINAKIQDHTIVTYHTVAASVADYIRNLPTHELANISSHIHHDMEEDAFLHKEAKENDGELYAKEATSMYHKNALQRNLDILICTPARLLQLMRWKAVVLNRVNYMVFDEADMLFTSRTHLPQNSKTAMAQLTSDQNQNISKFQQEKRKETAQRTPLIQAINQAQIRNGELYEALVPILRRLKVDYEFTHGFVPHVTSPNSIFPNTHSATTARRPSALRAGLLVSQHKQRENMIKQKFPHLYIKSPEFQHLLKQYEAEALVNDYGIMNVEATDANKSSIAKLLDQGDENREVFQQLKMFLDDSKTPLPPTLSTLTTPSRTELGETDERELKKVQRVSKNLQPVQLIYTSATLSSGATQFKQEINKIVPLYEEQYAPRQLIDLSTNDSLCVPTSVKQTFIHVGQRDKLQILTELLQSEELKTSKRFYGTQTMVFCNTIASARAVQHKLTEMEISCAGVHSGIPPRQRADNWERFFQNRLAVMVCTDIASRGVHHPSIRYIVNFDFPLSPVDYLHRAGRAATLPGQIGGNSKKSTKPQLPTSQQDPATIQLVDPLDIHDHDSELDQDSEDQDSQDSEVAAQAESRTPDPVILDPEGKPVQKRGEVISLVCKADQVLAYAINETSKKLAPITSLSADKSHYSVQQEAADEDKQHDHSRPQSYEEECVLSTSSPGYKKAKDKFLRQLSNIEVTQHGHQVTKPSLVAAAKRRAAKDWVLHRDKYSNQSRSVRKVDLTSDRRRADEKYVEQQTHYAESMGFNKPLLSKTAKINAEYPDRVLKKKVDLSLQGMREKSYRDRQNDSHHYDEIPTLEQVVQQRRTPSFPQASSEPKQRSNYDSKPAGKKSNNNNSKNNKNDNTPYSSSPNKYNNVSHGYGYKGSKF